MVGFRGPQVLLLVLLAGTIVSGPIGLSLAAHGADVPDSSATTLFVNATGDYGYTPDTFQNVPTNTTITVTFGDQSDMDHTFSIIGKEGWVIPSTDSSAQIDALAYGKSPPALLNLNVTPGTTNTSAFHSPGIGWYEFVCTVSGHFQNGMYGFIAFGMALPSNLTTPSRTGLSTSLSFSPIDAVVIAVVVALVVLLSVVWRRRREAQRRRFASAQRPRRPSAGAREPASGQPKGPP